ncbi:MAG: VCBS repeat-containing protein [Bacteroidota bacterium]
MCTLALLSFFSCSEENPNATLFENKSAKDTGIHFQNTIVSKPELNILNYIYFYNGAGVAAADFNNDGLIDLYFTANQSADKLYLNEGNLKFNDITEAAGIDNAQNWTTGVTTVDINNDGLLDIYISKLGAYQNINGKNLLYVNNGPNKDGIPTFTENAAAYQLDFIGLSTQASFFDYDLDGDLDLFLLNHSTNPNQNYGKGSIRNIPDEHSGDKLFENKNGQFENVSEQAGIFQSKIGYGLGLAVSDVNNDGHPDLYIGNDFFENDYLYINNGDKTFSETITTKTGAIGHTTHYSMGNDVADINNDGFTDIVSVDMLPEDLSTYKTSGSEFNYQIYQNYLRNGYTHQFMQNTLQLNNGNGSFSETAYQSGIAATEWSWSPLIADFDNDGLQDIYITNGILGATNDMDFINFIANDNIQKSLGEGMGEDDMAFIDKIPEKKTTNYFFKNEGNNGFVDNTETWSNAPPSFSNGAVYADLDNDGDLDIVTNNVNQPAFVLENTSRIFDGKDTSDKRQDVAGLLGAEGYVTIKFDGDRLNPFGIGTKVIVYNEGDRWLKENFTSRGYLSSVAPELHFGLGPVTKIDSMHIIWPDQTFETIVNTKTNRTITVTHNNASGNYYTSFRKKSKQFLTEVPPLFHFKHKENSTIDFNRNPLLAFAMSNEGPDVSVADINNDGLQDVFISGAKGQASQLFVQQKDGTFNSQQSELFEKDAINEDVAHVFFDTNGNSYKDLLVVSGGNEFNSGKPIAPRLYLNDRGIFKNDTLFIGLDYGINASQVKTMDLDSDGDLDAFIASGTRSPLDGPPTQVFLNNISNDGFLLSENMGASQVTKHGRCNDLLFVDLDGDGTNELVTTGDWSPISVYAKVKDEFVLQRNNGLDETHGWWNVIKASDIDLDGDLDLMVGNWGLNSRLQASVEEPLTLYTSDFDDNGSEETLITYYYQGEETPFVSKDELVKQMPSINKKYLSYTEFANASLIDIFGKQNLDNASQEKAYELGSCYFENMGNGQFKKHRLPFEAQISSVNDIWVEDFNNDGFPDLLLVGNNFEISPQLSSLDASHGVLLLNDSQGNFNQAKGQKFTISGAARNIEKLEYQGEAYLIITRNNDQPLFLKISI